METVQERNTGFAASIDVVVIAGVPGTGKTTVARRLAEALGYLHIDLTELALREKLYLEYDEERMSYVIDEERLVERVLSIVERHGKAVIDTHYPEILPPMLPRMVFVLRLHPMLLEERLRRRGWPWRKIKENIEAEILGVVTYNALERFGEDRVYEIDTTGRGVDEIVGEIMDVMRRGPGRQRIFVDWLSRLDMDVLSRYLD